MTAKRAKKSASKIIPKAKKVQPFTISKVHLVVVLILFGFLAFAIAQTKEDSIQYAQTAPSPSSASISATVDPGAVSPTYGCLGTSCVGSITPSVAVTVSPSIMPSVAPSTIPTISLPTNPNGKTPPGLIVSSFMRLRNWFSKMLRFGGNPPGNQNIPGTSINPIGSNSGVPIPIVSLGADGSTSGSVTFPTGKKNGSLIEQFLTFFAQLFGNTK